MKTIITINNLLILKDLHATTRKLILSGIFRSVGQGALIVDLTLYLDALVWEAFHIGWVLSVSGFVCRVVESGNRCYERPHAKETIYHCLRDYNLLLQ